MRIVGDDFDTATRLNAAGGPDLVLHTAAVASAHDVLRFNVAFANDLSLASAANCMKVTSEKLDTRTETTETTERGRHITEPSGGASNLFSIPQQVI